MVEKLELRQNKKIGRIKVHVLRALVHYKCYIVQIVITSFTSSHTVQYTIVILSVPSTAKSILGLFVKLVERQQMRRQTETANIQKGPTLGRSPNVSPHLPRKSSDSPSPMCKKIVNIFIQQYNCHTHYVQYV